MTPEEEVAAVRAALAEAGYPDAVAWPSDHPVYGPTVGVTMVEGPGGTNPPWEVVWRALAVAVPHRLLMCWGCWSASTQLTPEDCDHDPLTSPWPPVVRPEGVGA